MRLFGVCFLVLLLKCFWLRRNSKDLNSDSPFRGDVVMYVLVSALEIQKASVIIWVIPSTSGVRNKEVSGSV